MDARPRWLFALFVAVAALHLLPIWSVHLIPTVDGPSHVYNAVVLRELAAGSPEFSRVFVARLRPNPNWLGHALLFLFISVVPPLVAEKLLVSLIVLLFLAGCWRLGGPYAFLAMPLAFHLLLQMGFYNYSLGVGLVLHAIASWLRDQSGWRPGAWLLLCTFAHPLPAAAAIVFIAIAWLMTSRRWQRLLPLVAPALILGWFFLQPNRPGGQWTWNGALLWQPLFRMVLLFTFDQRQITFGTALGVVYTALIIATLLMDGLRTRPTVFLVLTLVAVAMYLAAPISIQEGLLLKARLLIFPFVLVLPWLTPRLARMPLAVALALVATANVFYIRECWKRNEKVMERAIAPISFATPRRTLLPLVFDHSTPFSHLGFLSHAVSYAAIDRRLVDFGDYEAEQTYFPVAFRAGLRRPAIYDVEALPATIDVGSYASIVDYVYTWKMPPRSSVETGITKVYDLVAADGDARLYARKTNQPTR